MGEALEEILDPDLPIVDTHQHLWVVSDAAVEASQRAEGIANLLAPVLLRKPRYLAEEFHAEVNCGHNFIATVYIECHSMYRRSGPKAFRSVGEVEFANGVAAMFASGTYGPAKVAAAIVGNVDLTLGNVTRQVLEAHIAAGGGRYRGVRRITLHDDDSSIVGKGTRPHILLNPAFQEGTRLLGAMGLSFDALVLSPQLPEVGELAKAAPDTRIIVNHAGGPALIGRYADNRAEHFSNWRRNLLELGKHPNVVMKVGGLAIPWVPSQWFLSDPPATARQLADEWRPYFDVMIEAFGVDRCMFESNFPVDFGAGSYRTLWNAFKVLTEGMSPSEKTALFSKTAIDTYRIDLER